MCDRNSIYPTWGSTEEKETARMADAGPTQEDIKGAIKALKRIDQLNAWRTFGTIGFDNYREWVLSHPVNA
jgi:hypothetical protein